MDKNRLIQILQDVTDPTSRSLLEAQKEVKGLPEDVRDSIINKKIIGPVIDVLSVEESFDSGGFWLTLHAGFSDTFDAERASIFLVTCVRNGMKPERAVELLGDTLKNNRAARLEVMALWGICITSPIELGQNIKLIPFSLLPDSSTKQRFINSYDPMLPPGYQRSVLASPPKAALIYESTFSPILYPKKDGEPSFCGSYNRDKLDIVRLILSVVTKSCLVDRGYWCQFNEFHLNEMLSIGSVTTHSNPVQPDGVASFVDFDRHADEAKELVSAFNLLNKESKLLIRLSLDRFNQAMCHYPSADDLPPFLVPDVMRVQAALSLADA